MTKSKLILIIILIVCVLLGLAYSQWHNQNSRQLGVIKVTLSPPQATISVGWKIYQADQGVAILKLPPNQYTLVFSYPGYSVVKKNVTVRSQETIDLGKIYLFPKSFQEEVLVADPNLSDFKTSPTTNFLIYFKALANNKYDWLLYNRTTKESSKFYQSPSLPQRILFAPDGKKIISLLPPHDWRVIFLPQSIVEQEINLTNRLKEALKETGLQTVSLNNLAILQVEFLSDFSNDDLLIRTNQGIYQFNYLDKSLILLVDSPTSPFLIDNEILYFVKDNGLLTSFDLEKNVSQQLSFFSFRDKEENLEQVKIIKLPHHNSLLSIKPNGQLYLFNNNQTDLPKLITSNVLNCSLSPNGLNLLIYRNDKRLAIYHLTDNLLTDLELYTDVQPQWFLDDESFFLTNNTQLKIYNFLSKETWPITNDLKNGQFLYDRSLNYLFLLTSQGLTKINL
ncbi:MAG: hypothetical protein QG648_38 [Patescibacteria group bacterium]|nr:hypothetical protein [Patescibacteria group bacterium]